MDNSATINQMQLEALAHEVCRSHSARPERDLYRICPSKLSKRELEDLYFALLENNHELKRTINSQNDKLKMLSTKVQRLSASKTPGSKDKDCCHSKTLIDEQKDSITELKKCNERMAERIRVLNMKLCSAKQFLKKQSPEQKNSNKSQSKTPTSFQKFKNVCDQSQVARNRPAIEYKISKSVEPSPDNPLAIGSPKPEGKHECSEDKCKAAIEELQKKISELQEELHMTQFNYTSKLHNLENEIRSVMDENVRARADSRALEERGDDLEGKLRAAEGRGADLETQLAIEKLKTKELETRLKLADSEKNLAKSLDQLTVIREKRDSDASAQPSYKFRPRQSFSEPKRETDVDSAVSYYKPQLKESETSVKSEPKRGDPEVESLGPVSSQKSYRKDSQTSAKIKKPKRGDPEVESLGPVSSQKSYRKDSQTSVKIKKPKRGDPEVESLGPVSSQKSYQKDSETSVKIKKPKRGDPEVESLGPVSSQKSYRKDSQTSVKIKKPKRGDPEVESLGPVSSQKSYRKDSQTSVKIKKPKRGDPEVESLGPVSSQKSYRKDSQTSVKIKKSKRGDPEVESLGPVSSQKSYRKDSQTSVKIKKPKRGDPEVESLGPVSSQKSYRKDSQTSVKIKKPKRGDPEVESLGPVSSQKSYRKDSQTSVKIKEPKPQESKVESEILNNELEPPKSPSKDQRKQSISGSGEPKPREYKVEEPPKSPSKGQRKTSIALSEEPKPREYKVEEEPPKSPSKGQRKLSIAVNEEPKPREYKVESEILKKEEESPKSPSKGQRKTSIALSEEPKPLEYKEPGIPKSEREKEHPKSPSKGQRKLSIGETKPQASKSKNELSSILTSTPNRKESPASDKLEEPKPAKSSHEVKFPQSDDSGYTDTNKSFDVEPEKDEEMLRVNRELLKKIADLKTQLDLLMIAAAGAKQDGIAPALSKPPASETKMMEDQSVPTKSLSMHSTMVGAKQDELAPAQSKPVSETTMMEDHSVPTKSLSTHSTKVPNEIEPKQQVQAKTEDKVKRTTSFVKPEIVQNEGEIQRQLANHNMPINISNEGKEQKPFPYKDHADDAFASENLLSSSEKNKPLADVKSSLLYEDQMDTITPYEIRAPRSSLYHQKSQEVKSQPNEGNDAIPSSNEDRVLMPEPFDKAIPMSSTNESKIQEPLIDLKTQRSYPSDEKLPMPPSAEASKHRVRKLSVTSYEDTPTLSPYQERPLTSPPYLNKAQKPSSFEYEVSPDIRLPSYHTFEKLHHKDIVDRKRESLFYKDQVSDFDVDKASIATPNADKKRDSLFYEDVQTPNLPFEDKIYPDEPQFIDDRTRTPDQYLEPKQQQIDGKRNSSYYAEKIENFGLDKNAPTTSSPYEEKMQKLNIGKPRSEEDAKSIRFESYIHMAERGSREYGPEFAKYADDPAIDDPKNIPIDKRRESSSIGTSQADDQDFQIPEPIPSSLKPIPIDKKKHPNSVDKTKKGITILEDEKVPSGYSLYFDPSSTSKNNFAAINDDVNKDFSQVTDNPKEIKDMYQNTSYNDKTPKVDSLFDMVREDANLPPSTMQEQGTQMDQHIENLQAPRRDSATYTQTDTQPQTYTLPKDAYTQPRRESLEQKTYNQDGTDEYPQQKAYKRDTFTQNAYNQDTYTQVGPQNAQTPRYSTSTTPDNTEKEISSLPDLPQEREIKPTQGYISPGEKATMTFTDNETNTDYGSLSEGELPSTKKATKSFGEKGVETTSGPGESPTQRMEDVLKSISEELARCHRLLASQKREERNLSEVNKPAEDDGVQLRASQGARRLTGAHHVCVFTLHIGTLVLSDEAVVQSRDKNLVLIWRFFDQSVTMTRMRPGRVVLFDFSTEYDVVFSEDFLNYMKFEKMPLLVCEINKQDKPFAVCYLPLRDALLHVNRRADMSLALTAGPGGDSESPSEELGVLDLWCILRCDAVITQLLTKSMARPSTATMSPRRSYHRSITEEDLSNERMSEDLDLNIKKESQAQDTLTEQMSKKSYPSYYPPEGGSRSGDAAVDELSTGTLKIIRRRSSLAHPRSNIVSFDGISNSWAANKLSINDAPGLIANAVPSSIRSTEEMKAALERNAMQEENRKLPKAEEKSLAKKNQLAKLKFTKKLSEDAFESLQDLIRNRKSDRRNSQPKYELPPTDKTENELAKKYNDITKLMVSRRDAAKKSVKYYSQNDEHPQRIQDVQREDPSPQSIEITILWLALNEECDAMINPDIKRLYVAYKFLGRNGAELETPVSLPKPKHYVDKCFFNFKKTFHLHDADLPALGHMARVRAGSRVSTDPRDCLVFTVVSEPPEDPLGLASCEDIGYAYLYLGDILAYASGSGAYTEVVAVHAARGSAVCGVLAVKIDGLHVLRRALTLSHSNKDLILTR